MVLFRPIDALQRRFEEWNLFVGVRSMADFVLMLKLGRHSLPW